MVLEGNILNGQQLINLRLKDANRDLPVIGQKEFQPTKSWLENKQIQSALYDRKSLLEEERVEKWSSLSTAEWLPDIKKAKVTKKVGKVWENFGHHAQDADWLFPEEALLLLETNALELLFNEIPLSIERGYCVLINENSGCTINEYRTFSHLVRLGYKLFRHLAEVSVTRYEKDIHLDQHVLQQKTTYSNETDNVVITDVTSEVDVVRQDTANNLNVNCDINSANDIVQINVVEESTNSDICVTNKDKDSVPLNKSSVDVVQDKQSDVVVDEDDDVIEIPIDEETIVVNEISSDSEADVVGTNESSSSEDEEDDDDDDSSVTSHTSNSNWKRNQVTTSTKNKQINIVDISNSSSPVPAVAIRTNYLTVNEFLFDPTQMPNNINNSKDNHEIIDISDDDIVVDKVTDNKKSLGKELQRFYKEIEIIDIDSDPEDLNKSNNDSVNITNLTRKDIMNSFPIFKNGVATVINVPPHHLLPPNIKPISKEYRLNFLTSDSIYNSYNTSNANRDQRESNWSNYNKNHRLQQFNKNCPNVRAQPQQNFQQAVPSRQYNNRSSYYHNRNRSMFPSSYLNTWNSWPVNDNSVQNQVSQIRAMATGMIQVASTLLSLPFVQQSMPRMPSLFYNQPIQQPFHSNPFNRVRFNNYNNNNNNNNNSNMQPLNQSSCSSNMIITNNNVSNPNFDQSYQHNQQTFTQLQNYSNYNVSSQPFGNNQPNNPSGSTMYNANYNEQQNIGRSYQRIVGNSSNINNSNNNNNNNRANDVNHSNQYKDDNMNREERYNDVSSRNNDNFSRNVNERYNSSDTNSAQGSGSGNNYRNKPRPMYFGRRKMPWGKKRYFGPKNNDNSFNRANEPNEDQCIIVDTDGDPSVFVEDIPVSAKDKSSENDEGFIPFSNNENESTSRRNNNDIIDIGGDNYMVIDDSERGRNNRSRPGKRRMNFMSIGRPSKSRPWFKRRNQVFPWRGPRNNNRSPSKNPRNDGQSNFQINDGIEVINEIRNNLSNLKKNKRKFDNNDNADVTEKQRARKRRRRNRNTDTSNNSIEVIDIETDNQSPVTVKKENNKGNTEIKKEISCDNQQNKVQQDTDLIDKSNTDKEDNVSRFSRVCNSLINNNSMDSSTSSVTAITTVTVKNESSSLKQEKECYTTSILTSETFTNSTSRTNMSVKVENVSSVKIESNPILSKTVIGENIKTEEELVNVKSEKSNEIVDKGNESQLFVKLEESKKEPEEPISVDIKIESDKNISNSETNNDKNVNEQNENVLNTIQQSTEVQNSLNIAVQNENVNDKIGGEPEFVSWAQLKQQQQPTVNEERSELVEVSEEQENETDEEEDEIHPLITANDCKSLGTVLSALQIIGSAEFPVTNERKLKISYDVYMPNVPIKKSSRKLPNYRLVIVDFRDDLPTASEMAELNNRFEDGVPILIAIVLPDSVSFFSAATVKLPTDDGS